jgi:hypothetical protein
VSVNGGIECSQAVTVDLLAHVAGGIDAPSASGAYTGGLGAAPLSNPVPDFNSVIKYTNYTYGGSTYSSVLVNPSANNNVSGTNPAGIFYASGNVALRGPMTIHGSLWVPNGSVTFQGSVTITPAAGYPAIITSGNIASAFLGSHLTANGTVYAGTGIGAGDTLSTMTINGSLLSPTSGTFNLFLGAMAVNYNAAKASVPNLTSNGAYLTPTSVKLTAWNP